MQVISDEGRVMRCRARKPGSDDRGRSLQRDKGGQPCTITINPVAHTAPYRLSVNSGEKMNPFAEFENRQSVLAAQSMTAGWARLPRAHFLLVLNEGSG